MKSKIILYTEEMHDLLTLLDPNIFKILHFKSAVYTSGITPMFLRHNITSWELANLPGIDLAGEIESAQQVILNNFDIKTPGYIFARTDGMILHSMDLNKKYVIKALTSARSMGKAIVDFSTLNDMQYFVADESQTYETFNKQFNVNVGKCYTENEKDKLFRAIKNVWYYLSEFVSVKEEYRVIYTRGTPVNDYVVEHRKGYGPDSKETRTHVVVNSVPNILLPMLEQLKSFGDSTEYPCIAFDVYITTDNETGVFEYNPTFGTQFPNETMKILRAQLTEAFLLSIKKVKEKYPELTFG